MGSCSLLTTRWTSAGNYRRRSSVESHRTWYSKASSAWFSILLGTRSLASSRTSYGYRAITTWRNILRGGWGKVPIPHTKLSFLVFFFGGVGRQCFSILTLKLVVLGQLVAKCPILLAACIDRFAFEVTGLREFCGELRVVATVTVGHWFSIWVVVRPAIDEGSVEGW